MTRNERNSHGWVLREKDYSGSSRDDRIGTGNFPSERLEQFQVMLRLC